MSAGREREVMARPDVYTERLADDLVLFSPDDRRLHVLNATAARVWDAIASPRAVGDVVIELSEEFGAAAIEIVDDITMLIERLLDEGLCHSVSDVTAADGDQNRAEQSRIRDTARVGAVGEALVLQALGIVVVVETDDALLANELRRVFAPLEAPTRALEDGDAFDHIVITAANERWHVTRNGARVSTVATRERAIRLAVSECNSAPLASIDDAVVLHSAAVDLGRGAVLFPGVSNAGKSTLAAQLLLRGHAYITDEAAAVDIDSLAVRPFHKSICIEAGAQHLFPDERSRRQAAGLPVDDGSPWDLDPRVLGDGSLSTGGPILGVVFPVFDAEAEPSMRPLAPVEALRLLVTNAFEFSAPGHAAFSALAHLARALPCYVMTHHGGTGHLDQIELLFAGRVSRRVQRR